MPGDKQCLPVCLLLGHEACSTGDVVSKCHCKNQLRNPEHKLEQVGDRPGVFAGTCVYGHQAAGQASTSFPQSKKDGQIVCERGQCGTCCTCVGQTPSESQHVPMCTEASNCPGRRPILVRCQWPDTIRKYKQKLVSDYWKLVSTMVSHGRDAGLDTNRVGAYPLLWTCYEYLSGMGRSLVIGGRMDYTYNLLASQRRMAKAYLRMINGPSPYSRGLELVLNKGLFPRCLPPWGSLTIGPSWRWHVSSAANCQWQMSTGDTTWLRRCQKGDAYQSRGSGKIWMGPYGSGNGWICVISSVVDWP